MNTKNLKAWIMIIMILTLSACSDSGKPSPNVTLEQIQTDAVEVEIIKTNFDRLVSLSVISQPVQGTQSLVIADLTYDNGEALVSGQVVINYEWINKAWKPVNTQFTYDSVSVKEEPSDEEVLNAIAVIEDLNSRFQNAAFNSEPVLVSRTPNLKKGEAIYVVRRTASVENWTSTTTTTIKAKYDHSQGWQYTVDQWDYSETTRWTGTWVVQWATYDKETQYAANEKITMTLTGEMTLTQNSADQQDETRKVNVVFKRNGSSFNLPATISRNYEDQGLYSTRFIVIKYGNQDNDQLFFELDFDLTGPNPIALYVAKSFDGNNAILTKIK